MDPAVAWVQPVLGGVNLPADPSSLHHAMHEYLAGCGVDGVKARRAGCSPPPRAAASAGPGVKGAVHTAPA